MTIEVSEVLGAPAGSPANFPSMPTVGGDPVVESGSNSDGEWTRFADGTQHVRKIDDLGTISAVAIDNVAYVINDKGQGPLPLPFISVSTCAFLMDGASSASFWIAGKENATSVAWPSVLLFSNRVRTDATGAYLHKSATGRWK